MIKKETSGQVDESVVEYTYNELNQLTGYKQPNDHPRTYVYDGTGMRVSSSDGYRTTKYYWDRGYVANETYQGNISATNYIGVQGIFARTYDGETNYLFKNGHGDVTNTAKNGVKGYSFTYDAYGNEESSSADMAVPMRYSGEYQDLCSGLIYLRNRYYDPSIGRFITEDPARDGLNWYVYANNNPIKYIDPSGLYYLEKDKEGQVYAVIESGDTLSNISYSEVADANAYLDLDYAEPGFLEVGQRVNITGIYNENYPVPTNIMLSKTGHTQGDSGLRDVPDEEISRRARDRNLSGEERRRYQREEKLRGQRNKQKRQSHYSVQSQLPYPNTSFSPVPTQSAPKVNMPDSQFCGKVGAGVITVVGVAAGIYYFCYTGDPSMIYQYIR